MDKRSSSFLAVKFAPGKFLRIGGLAGLAQRLRQCLQCFPLTGFTHLVDLHIAQPSPGKSRTEPLMLAYTLSTVERWMWRQTVDVKVVTWACLM